MIGRLFRREAEGQETALKKFLYVRGGAETLVRHLWEHAQAAGAELRLDCPVKSLDLDERNWVRAAEPLAEELPIGAPGQSADAGAPIPGDLFLSTVPLPILLQQILPRRPSLEAAREASSGLLYLNMIFVCLIVRRPSISKDSWLYFPEPHLIFNRAYEAKNFDPAMGASDRSIFCLEITLRAHDPISREADESIIRTVKRQIASTGLFREDEVEESMVHRLLFAYPLYTLDYATRLDCALEGLRQVPNLVTLGRQGLFNHNNMDHSMYMGLCAADLFNALPPAEAVGKWYDSIQRFKMLRIVD
jgi:protoporphyrinogen oxidase